MKKSKLGTEIIFDNSIKKHMWLSKNKVKAVVDVLLKKEKIQRPLTIVFTDNRTIRRLNRDYRYRDEATDVLSFEYGGKSELLGEIIISLQTAKRQAVKYGNSCMKETFILLIHGFYHVLGYSHYKKAAFRKMKKKEESALQLLLNKRMLN
ncbi:MAG: rRNA maturation RNase YbeY [Candidatus Firestonebacteria bacterium GWA2_43_8]|nr:MAG: rRNA maturation RNase YbeY [Candidatus Firestonebacteria bacterium GWA2_43_8]